MPSISVTHTASSIRRIGGCIIVVSSIAFAFFLQNSLLRAADTGPTEQPPQVTKTDNDPKPSAKTPDPKQDNLDAATLKSYGFSPGIAAIFMNKAGVENATVDAGGIVRVDESSKSRAGGVLELHYFVHDIRKKKAELNDIISQKAVKESVAKAMGAGATTAPIEFGKVVSDIAYGPTFVIELGENVVRSAGIGWLWSWRDLNREVQGTTITYTTLGSAFNLGFVALCEPNVKVLGSGLQKNVKLPTGDAIRFDHEAHFGLAVMASFNF